jgi:hypothetical protein
MTVTINDFLLARAERAAEEAQLFKEDTSYYVELCQHLPRVFPAPDDILTRQADLDADIIFIYKIQSDEKAEALRMVLGMTFSISEWRGELQKDGGAFSVCGSCNFNGRRILLTILGADLTNYEFTTTEDVGGKLIGPIKCVKFVPFDIIRPDLTNNTLQKKSQESDLASYYAKHRSKLLTLLGHHIPSKTPIPDDVVVGLGSSFDVDFIYSADLDGKLRRAIDKRLGYQVGWTFAVYKQTFVRTLHTLIDVSCENYNLKVRISILNPYLPTERLLLVADTQDHLLYKAIRRSDPDAAEFRSHLI